jgi:hypothetical protein
VFTGREGEEERQDFFFEKKKQKTFESLSRALPVDARQCAKVFWFFFSKKNIFSAPHNGAL